MPSRFPKVRLARTVALTVVVGATGSLALTGTGLAAPPPTGQACAATAADPTNGKISGRGASFARAAMNAFIAGYTTDVCGPVASDPASTTSMLHYNRTLAPAAPTGSGNGLVSASCRSDAFHGTDIPYDQGGATDIAFGLGTLDKLEGPPGVGVGNCANPVYTPSYQPSPTYPDAADTAGTLMSFPVAGSSNAIAINLAPGAANGCPNRTTQTQAIQLTSEAMTLLSGGDILTWGDARLRTGGINANLLNCTTPVSRVVRRDKSGTTQIFKTYLANVDPARNTTTAPARTCDTGNTWLNLELDANNTAWPGAPTDPGTGFSSSQAATATCSAVTQHPSGTGNGPMITHLRTVNGGFAYPDLADAVVVGTPALTLASLRNATNTSFQAPSAGNPANCDFPVSLPSGGSTTGAVGLDRSRDPSIDLYTNDTWAFNNDAPWPVGQNPYSNHSDTTFKGSKYPICGLTYMMVYTGLNNGAVANPISRLTANQRRTLYSFFSYVMSPAAQSRMAAARYAPLPANFVAPIRAGFQANF